jgi:hypothetical protein
LAYDESHIPLILSDPLAWFRMVATQPPEEMIMRIENHRQGGIRNTSRRTQSRLQRAWQIGKEAVDLAAKLAGPLAVIAGVILAQHFQSASTVSQLLQQREESDTKIRAEMFRAITDRLFSEKGGSLPPDQQAVFAALLALNFHEHIELKPLMLEIDSMLAERKYPAGVFAINVDRPSRRRDELRAVARRVRARQTAMLVAESATPDTAPRASLSRAALVSLRADGGALETGHGSTAKQPHSDGGRLEFVGVRSSDVAGAIGSTAGLACDVRPGEGQNTGLNQPVWISTPNGQHSIALTVEQGDWNNERFDLSVKFNPGKRDKPQATEKPMVGLMRALPGGNAPLDPAIAGQSGVVFQASWFDFPLTDNTLLASGDRFAVFIDQVCNDKATGRRAVRFGILWFPKDYFPARERPTNYRELRNKLGLENRS